MSSTLHSNPDSAIAKQFVRANESSSYRGRWALYARTALRLGIMNAARVATYRIAKQTGIYEWLRPCCQAVPLNFVSDSRSGSRSLLPGDDEAVIAEAEELLTGKARFFSAHLFEVGNPPDWFLNPFTRLRHTKSSAHWSKIAHFQSEDGDIKVTWELSRFTWAPLLAQAFRSSGDARYRSALEQWIRDWWQNNPPNTGPNWMCGQETAIRLVNALLAMHLIGWATGPESGLSAFIEAHCRRIALTTPYAVAQDNNHATSEAAGLFLGGAWLCKHGRRADRTRAQQWARKGRKLLERSVHRLVMPDGSFSQHSLTYHRLLLDTLSITELLRQQFGEPPLTDPFYSRAAAATTWLQTVIDPCTGDGPNLGANDGAYPYRLSSASYRDFRPCLQIASKTFLGSSPRNERAVDLGSVTTTPETPQQNAPATVILSDGGYVIMRNSAGAYLLLRAPTTRFRPSQADALHLELWWKGTNVLRDGGTYSYAERNGVATELSSVVGHNTVQFDDRDQMPRLGRFLYGNWVCVTGEARVSDSKTAQSWKGGYTDSWGARHEREITLRANALTVKDLLQGFRTKAVLRWRLAPGNWRLEEAGCMSDIGTLRVESTVPIHRMCVTNGWESRHYLEKSVVPVLEIEVQQTPATVSTKILFS